jgi:hypothetical protein
MPVILVIFFCPAIFFTRCIYQGRIQDFKLGGAHLKKSERREARKFWGYFVWKITILRQKIIFFPIAEGGAKNVGVFRVKNHDYTPKNHIFSNFRGGGARRVRPPLDPPPVLYAISTHKRSSYGFGWIATTK